MLRRFFRGRPSRRSGRTRSFARLFARYCRIPLLIAAIAAFTEVYLHRRHWAVHQPEHELDEPFYKSCQEPATHLPRENAALVMLARNSELIKALRTVHSIEKHFNQWFHYPIVFLNDEPWSDEFINAMNATVSGEARFEIIPKSEWLFPDWMDTKAAKESIAKQGRDGILYGGLETYHHMCRFYSGKFYTLEALKQYKWYWRIEPDVDFYCSVTYDPFLEMAKHDKLYGFTISLPEEPRTCPSLFREIADWKEDHDIPTTELWKATVSASWVPWPFRSALSWFGHRDRKGDSWSLCHYWSNFEIANLEFFRGKEYQDLFEHLEKTGGFYNERWGDAAVHSLALAMLLEPQRVHHFEDFGYRHDWFFQCPANAPGGQLLESKTLGTGTDRSFSPERPGGVGCRCECDGAKTRNYASYCLNKLKQPNTTKRISTIGWFRSWFK
ncbi:nucleotide-diphospho-sugar transferase [Bombardia bombarda]|uniref:Nucleotide-diphospho-sugar transferase n=1 Tax=Bombardia bombarda TaxID=252184 RepID=A0AA40C9C1_9PEZI|nr:nucleotide-diphospho-sugar transferase [Bombardia bombarda]